ncbi:inositol 2-dehydrogenase [Actinomycetes bacterium M1A6_2h]
MTPWPEGFKEHLVAELDGFSPITSRAIADNGASLFKDGPYGHHAATMDATSGMWHKIRSVAHEFLWPR